MIRIAICDDEANIRAYLSSLIGAQSCPCEIVEYASLIYANATIEMKQAAIKKISTKENSVFKDDKKFKYGDNDDIIKRLYGLT